MSISRVFTSHWMVTVGIMGGVLCGLMFKDYGKLLQPFAQMYINLLQISVIPIIIMSVTTGISKLTSDPSARDKIWRISATLLGLLILSASLATVVGYFSEPGEGLSRNKEILSVILDSGGGLGTLELRPDQEIVAELNATPLKLLLDAIPSNIFAALSQGAVLQIIVFSLILGVALGIKQSHDAVNRSKAFDTLLPVFETIIKGILVLLPFGIFCMFASQLGSFSLSTFVALAKLAFVLCSAMAILIVIFIGIIWFYSKRSLSEVLRSLSYLALMAASTRSTLACIPISIESMSKLFGREMASLVIPFGNITCRFGSIVLYAIGTIFIAELFSTSLSIYGYLVIVFCSILAAFGSSGATGIVTLQMITIVLDPLGLPLGPIFALFVAIDPIVDIFDTLANVFGNCAAVAICGNPVEGDLVDKDVFSALMK